MRKPLTGVTVVAVEQAVAAPFCTARLADAGARVIKIERPEGDFARGYDTAAFGESSYFVWLNRGKQSVVLDLALEPDRKSLGALISGADVFVQNLKPGALERLGFSLQALRQRHPSLICCSITGYGDHGPYADRKAYDLLIQADSGLCSVTGTAGSSARVGISVVDIATGATAYSAVLEALITRSHSGSGCDIRVSMFDVIADWLTVPLLQAEGGQSPKRMGLAHPSIAPYGVFQTRDEQQLLIAVQNDREWKLLWECVFERRGPALDERLATNVRRVSLRQETDALVAERCRELNAAPLLAKLSAAQIAFAQLNDLHGLSRHPHLRRVEVETALGSVSLPAPAPVIDGLPSSIGPVPRLGQHTDEVLAGVLASGATK